MLIICCGMQRSGSTLQYNIVRRLAEITGTGRSAGYFDGQEIEDALVDFEQWAGERSITVIKVHDLAEKLRNMSKSQGVRICFTHRDLRDAAVSIQLKFKAYGEELLQRLDNAIGVHRFVAALPIDHQLVQGYEEMRDQLPQVIARHAEFLGLDTAPDVIDKLAAELGMDGGVSIYRMAFLPAVVRKILNRALGAGRFDRTTLWHPDHISRNRGRSGIWHDQLDPDTLSTIENRYHDHMVDCGYIRGDDTLEGR
jgi:hypothetical protein